MLGAGFGGLELSTRLSEALGDELDLVLLDKNDGFVFGFSKLDVMFGHSLPSTVVHHYRDLVKPGVTFVQTTIRSIDPVQKHVDTDAGGFDADIMVVALGADVDPSATPGLVEAGHEFYSVPAAFALREVLADFKGGKVVVGVTSTPFKCPPAPSETVLLMHHYLSERGIRDDSEISLVMPFGAPIPPSPEASGALLAAFAERGIQWHPDRSVKALDPDRKIAILSDSTELQFDLFLGVPVHKAPAVIIESRLAVDGWVQVDPMTLETSFPDVFAVGDVASVGTPKAGVFAEGQASVVAEQIIARVLGTAEAATYDGRGVCYLDFGGDLVARVEVAFMAGEKPAGKLEGPSVELAYQKVLFGSSRIQRWFDRSWTSGKR